MTANKLLIHVDLDEMFPEEEPAEGQAYLHLCTDGYLIQFLTKVDGTPTPAVYEVEAHYNSAENGPEIAGVSRPRKQTFHVEVVQEHRGVRRAMAKIMADVTDAVANEDDEFTEPCYGPWPKNEETVKEMKEPKGQLREAWEEHCAKERKKAEKAVDAIFRLFS
jgi:hypothetical protein